MSEEQIMSFLMIARMVVKQMTTLSLDVYDNRFKHSIILSNDITIIAGISGDFNGNVFINLPRNFAEKLSAKMIGKSKVDKLDDFSKSAILELGNIIIGCIATLFSKENIDINVAPPILICKENISLITDGLSAKKGALCHEDNVMEINIALQGE